MLDIWSLMFDNISFWFKLVLFSHVCYVTFLFEITKFCYFSPLVFHILILRLDILKMSFLYKKCHIFFTFVFRLLTFPKLTNTIRVYYVSLYSVYHFFGRSLKNYFCNDRFVCHW